MTLHLRLATTPTLSSQEGATGFTSPALSLLLKQLLVVVAPSGFDRNYPYVIVLLVFI